MAGRRTARACTPVEVYKSQQTRQPFTMDIVHYMCCSLMHRGSSDDANSCFASANPAIKSGQFKQLPDHQTRVGPVTVTVEYKQGSGILFLP